MGSPQWWETLVVSCSAAAHLCPVPRSLPKLAVRAPKVSNQQPVAQTEAPFSRLTA